MMNSIKRKYISTTKWNHILRWDLCHEHIKNVMKILQKIVVYIGEYLQNKTVNEIWTQSDF